jgi:hypothetical protein
MKDNGCACAVLSIPLLLLVWVILNPLWALFFGVTISSVAGSKTEFGVGDEISWSIDSSDEDLSPQLREYANRSGGSVDFEATIVGMTDYYYRLHVTDEVSYRKLSGGGSSAVNYYLWVPRADITPLDYRGEYSTWTWLKGMALGGLAVLAVWVIFGALGG